MVVNHINRKMSNILACTDEKTIITEENVSVSQVSHGRSMPPIDFLRKRGIHLPGIVGKKPHKELKNGDISVKEIVDYHSKNSPSKGLMFGFFGNIRRCLRSKKLSLCLSKQKVKDDARLWEFGEGYWDEYGSISGKKLPSDQVQSETAGNHVASSVLSACDVQNTTAADVVRTTHVIEATSRETVDVPTDRANPSNNDTYDGEHDNDNDNSNNDEMWKVNKEKVSLTEELIKLNEYSWYWGPISGDEADAKLMSEPDGAFLVRDSSDDRYLLTLSFKSSGKLLHARLEHSGGLFSLCNHEESGGFTSVAALIGHSMNHSQSAVFCYSRPRYPGHPSFPVRLTKPVSRFTQVRSLQYLCRSIIRQCTKFDDIRKLPLPKNMRKYLEEAHF